MNKSQFNIKISKDLLTRIKRQAIKSGKSLTEHITDLISQSLEKNINDDIDINGNKKINEFEKRLNKLESVVKNREYISPNIRPFTNSEAINCSNFMRGIFDQEVERKDFKDKSEAFTEFLNHINNYSQLSDLFANRLEDVILSDNPTPWTGKELNTLTDNVKCNCPIRLGLINWTGINDCPSQQEICEKGEKLLPL